MENYDNNDQKYRMIQNEYTNLLFEFRGWLKDMGLADKTIRNHIFNVDFFINAYLLARESLKAKDGVRRISTFLGYWFIRKAVWSNVTQIKGNAASFKKFYKFMYEKGEIDYETLEEVNWLIKDEMSEWIEEMKKHDDLHDSDYLY